MNEQQRKVEGERIRIAREARGWNQKELAEAAEVSPNTVGDIERGTKRTQPGKLSAVRGALGLKPMALAMEEASAYPRDVEIVRDALGLWLTRIPEDKRADYVARIMATIVNGD